MADKTSDSAPSGREAQILEASLDLFSRDGYDRVTVKQIAHACEVTEPAIYRYFPSKEALFNAVLDSIRGTWKHDELFEQLQTATNIEQLLRGMAEHILAAYCNHEKSCRLLLYSALREKSRASSIYQSIRGRYVQFLSKQLDRLFEQGLIVQRNNTITARCFIGMVFECAMGFSLWKGMQGEIFPPEQVVANNVPIYVRGLSK